jgi:hypothetical protein
VLVHSNDAVSVTAVNTAMPILTAVTASQRLPARIIQSPPMPMTFPHYTPALLPPFIATFSMLSPLLCVLQRVVLAGSRSRQAKPARALLRRCAPKRGFPICFACPPCFPPAWSTTLGRGWRGLRQQKEKDHDEGERHKKPLQSFKAFGIEASMWPPNGEYGETEQPRMSTAMTNISNETRAQRAEAALMQHVEAKGEVFENSSSEMADLIADLLHLAARLDEGDDPVVSTLLLARMHFDAEHGNPEEE